MNKLIIFPVFILMLLFIAGLLSAFPVFSYTENGTFTVGTGLNANNLNLTQCEQYSVKNTTDSITGARYYLLPNGSTLTVNAFGFELGINNNNYHSYSGTGTTLLSFGFDYITGFLLIIGAVMILVGVTGLRIFDIGLDTFSTKTITLGAIYIGVWTFISSFAVSLLNLIPMGLGIIVIYLPLSLMYVFGFFQTLTHESG
jgi:hypothetical protein